MVPSCIGCYCPKGLGRFAVYLLKGKWWKKDRFFEAVRCLCGWRQELGTHEGETAEAGVPTVRTESG